MCPEIDLEEAVPLIFLRLHSLIEKLVRKDDITQFESVESAPLDEYLEGEGFQLGIATQY